MAELTQDDLVNSTIQDLEAWLTLHGLELRIRGANRNWLAWLVGHDPAVGFGEGPNIVEAIRAAIADSGLRLSRGG